MEALIEWESAVAVYESKYGEPLGNREKITALRYIMPPQIFCGEGQLGLFRGRRIESYDEMRMELVRYIDDKPVPTVSTSGFTRDLNAIAEELQAVLQGGDPEAISTVLGETELGTMYKQKGKGKPKGKTGGGGGNGGGGKGPGNQPWGTGKGKSKGKSSWGSW